MGTSMDIFMDILDISVDISMDILDIDVRSTATDSATKNVLACTMVLRCIVCFLQDWLDATTSSTEVQLAHGERRDIETGVE